MAENKHEINRIRLELDGQLSEKKLHELKDEILKTIEECFDKYSDVEDHIYLDRIELDLGNIKEENFLQEFKIRIAYLLQQEFEKSLPEIRELQQLSPPKRQETRLAKNFMDYLVLGRAVHKRDTDLSSLFEELSTKNIDAISEIFNSEFFSESAKMRLFHQVKFSQLESYWSKTNYRVYQEIQKVNQQLVEEFRERILPGFTLTGAQGILKKLTFDYLLSKSVGQPSIKQYIAEVRKKIELFKPYEEQLNQPLEVIISKLGDAPATIDPSGPLPQVDSDRWKEFLQQKFTIAFRSVELVNKRILILLREKGIKETKTVEQQLLQLATEYLTSTQQPSSSKYFDFLLSKSEILVPTIEVNQEEYQALIEVVKQGSTKPVESESPGKIELAKKLVQGEILKTDQKSEVRFFISNQRNDNDLKSLIPIIDFETTASNVVTQIQKVKSMMSDSQFYQYFELIADSKIGKYHKEFERIISFHKVIQKHYSVNILSILTSSRAKMEQLLSGKTGDVLSYLIDTVQARKTDTREEIILRTISEIKATKETKASKEILAVLEEFDISEEEVISKFPEGSLLSQYMYFLKTGIWKNIEIAPQEALASILEESIQPLINQLRTMLSERVAWVRLIFQNPVETVFEIFREVFGQDESFEEFTVAYQEFKDQPEFERSVKQLFELYIEYKILSQADEVSFPDLLTQIQEEIQLSKPSEAPKSTSGILIELEEAIKFQTISSDELKEQISEIPEPEIRKGITPLLERNIWQFLPPLYQYLLQTESIVTSINVGSLRTIIQATIEQAIDLVSEEMKKVWSELKQDSPRDIEKILKQKPYLLPEEEYPEIDPDQYFDSLEVKELFSELEETVEFKKEDIQIVSKHFKSLEPFFDPTTELIWSAIERILSEKSIEPQQIKVLTTQAISKEPLLVYKFIDLILQKPTKSMVDEIIESVEFENQIIQLIDSKMFDWTVFSGVPEEKITQFLSLFSIDVKTKIQEVITPQVNEVYPRVEITVEKQIKFEVKQLLDLLKPIGKDSEFYDDLQAKIEEQLPIASNTFDLKIAVIKELDVEKTYSSTMIQALANNWFRSDEKSKLVAHSIEKILNADEQQYLEYLVGPNKNFEESITELIQKNQFDWTVFYSKPKKEIEKFLNRFTDEFKKELFIQLGLPEVQETSIDQVLAEIKISKTEVPVLAVNIEELLIKSIISGKLELDSVFISQKEFEEHLMIVFVQDKSVLKVFERSGTDKVIDFIKILSTPVVKEIQQLVETKFPSSTYGTIKSDLIAENTSKLGLIEELSMAYTLTNQRFMALDYVEFLDDQIPELNIPIDPLMISTPIDAERIEITPQDLIENLIFDKKPYRQFVAENLEYEVIRIISEKPVELLKEIKRLVRPEFIIKMIIESIPQEKQQWTLHQLAPETYPSISIKELASRLGIKPIEIFTKLLIQKIQFGMIGELEQVFTPDQEVKDSTEIEKAPTEVELYYSEEKNRSVLSLGIKPQFLEIYDSYHLLEEIVSQGRIPLWSSIKAVQEIKSFIENLITWDPQKTKRIIIDQLQAPMNQESFFGLVGDEIYFQTHQLIDKKRHSELVNSVAITLKEISIPERIRPVVQARLLKESVNVNYRFSSPSDETINQKLIEIIEDLKIDISSGVDVSQKEIQDSKSQTSEAAKKEPQEPKINQESTTAITSFFSQEELAKSELAISLLEDKKLPWWAKTKEFTQDPAQEKTVIELLINQDSTGLQKALKYLVQQKGKSGITHLIKILSTEEYQTIITKAQPNFVGFIESFQMIIELSKLAIQPKEWQQFVLEFTASTSSFVPRTFINESVRFVAKQTSENAEIIVSRILSNLAESNEARFLPIQQLLMAYQDLPARLDVAIDKPKQMSFEESLEVYLKTGIYPTQSEMAIKSTTQFVRQLNRVIQSSSIKEIIRRNVSNQTVLQRIIKNEPEVISWSIIQFLFVPEHATISHYYVQLKKVFSSSAQSYSQKSFSEKFLEQLINKSSDNRPISTIVKEVVKTLQEEFKLKAIDIDPFQLESLGLEPSLFDLSVKVASKEPEEEKLKVPSDTLTYNPDQKLEDHILVKTAGIVMFAPYLGRYFDMLQMTANGQFKDVDTALRGVHLLNFIATGQSSAPEHELLLNKVLCGVPILHPLPMEIEVTDQEREITEGMIKGAVLQNWDRMKKSSIEALREGFLVRDGYLSEKDKNWELKVEKKTLDILMESIPWSFSTVKLPWMEKLMKVEWQ